MRDFGNEMRYLGNEMQKRCQAATIIHNKKVPYCKQMHCNMGHLTLLSIPLCKAYFEKGAIEKNARYRIS